VSVFPPFNLIIYLDSAGLDSVILATNLVAFGLIVWEATISSAFTLLPFVVT